jgi:hypothetical protein
MSAMQFLDSTPEQQARLTEVFDLVKDKERWKDPIRAFVPESMATSKEIVDAVIFCAGGMPEVVPAVKGGITGWAVTGAGYYVWIGA